MLRRQKLYFGSKTTKTPLDDEKRYFCKLLTNDTFARSIDSDLQSSQRGSETQHLQRSLDG